MATMEKKLVFEVSEIAAVTVRCKKCGGDLRKVYGRTDREFARANCGFCNEVLIPEEGGIVPNLLASQDAYRKFKAELPVEVSLEIVVTEVA